MPEFVFGRKMQFALVTWLLNAWQLCDRNQIRHKNDLLTYRFYFRRFGRIFSSRSSLTRRCPVLLKTCKSPQNSHLHPLLQSKELFWTYGKRDANCSLPGLLWSSLWSVQKLRYFQANICTCKTVGKTRHHSIVTHIMKNTIPSGQNPLLFPLRLILARILEFEQDLEKRHWARLMMPKRLI